MHEKDLTTPRANKRVLWWTLFAAGLVFLFALRFYRANLPISTAAPAAAELILSGANAREWLTNGGLIEEFAPADGSITRDLAAFREFFSVVLDEKRAAVFSWLLCYHETGPQGPALGLALDIRRMKRAAIDSLLDAASRHTEYRGMRVARLEWPPTGTLYATRYRNLLLLGRFSFLVEEMAARLSGATRRRRWLDGSAPLSLWVSSAFLRDAGLAALAQTPLPDRGLTLSLEGRLDSLDIRGVMTFDEKPPGALALSFRSGRGARPEAIFGVLPAYLTYLSWRACPEPRACLAQEGEATPTIWSALGPWLGEELAWGRASGARGARLAALRLAAPAEARQALYQLADQYGALEDFEHNGFRVCRPMLSAFPQHQGEWMPRNPYCVFAGDYLLLADSRAAIELWLDAYSIGATLANSDAFLTFWKAHDRPWRAFWLAERGALERLLPERVSSAVLRRCWAGHSYVGVGWHSGDARRLSLLGHWRAPADGEAKARILWRAAMGGSATGAPLVFRGAHRRAAFIFACDTTQRCHLFDAEGRVRWSKRLESMPLPGAHAVDVRSGDEILFATRQAIHLLDSAGRSIAPYPLRIAGGVAAPALAARWDATGEGLGVFAGGRNGNIYGYDRAGEPLGGWRPLLDIGELRWPMLHFQRDGKDFLCVSTRDGALHVFSRNGDYRFPPLKPGRGLAGPPMLANTPGGERIVAPTVDGRVCELNFDGRLSLRALPLGARRASAFCLVDFDGKNRPHYIVQAENVILAFRQSGRGIELDFSIDLDQPADSLFAVTLPGRQAQGLGTLHRRLRQIRLHDRQGRLFAGFPLAGDTGFRIEDLHGDDRRVVVVAHRETLYAYELP